MGPTKPRKPGVKLVAPIIPIGGKKAAASSSTLWIDPQLQAFIGKKDIPRSYLDAFPSIRVSLANELANQDRGLLEAVTKSAKTQLKTYNYSKVVARHYSGFYGTAQIIQVEFRFCYGEGIDDIQLLIIGNRTDDGGMITEMLLSSVYFDESVPQDIYSPEDINSIRSLFPFFREIHISQNENISSRYLKRAISSLISGLQRNEDGILDRFEEMFFAATSRYGNSINSIRTSLAIEFKQNGRNIEAVLIGKVDVGFQTRTVEMYKESLSRKVLTLFSVI